MAAPDRRRQWPVHRTVRLIATPQPRELPGWYGKLPTLGDFASRRLAPGWIEAWDAWLAAGLQAWRERDVDHWLNNYLQAPSLRFLLMPGVLTDSRSAASGWVGVLMPSVDQSGRYFPLTLVQPLPRMPVDSAQIGRLLDWLRCLDDLAVTALEQDWTLDQMETGLQDLGALPDFEPGQLAPHLTQPMALQTEGLHADLAAVLQADKVAPARQLRHAQALWWFADESGKEHLRVTTGLPKADDFSALLSSP